MDEYLGSIKLFAAPFAPKDWAYCAGQLLNISSYQALYSIIGTTYGGDGRITFALPDLRGRVPIGTGKSTSPGITPRKLGENGGEVTHTLLLSEMPAHKHAAFVSKSEADAHTPQDLMSSLAPPTRAAGRGVTQTLAFSDAVANLVPLSDATIDFAGGNDAHNNVQPSLGLNYIICINGLFPPRP